MMSAEEMLKMQGIPEHMIDARKDHPALIGRWEQIVHYVSNPTKNLLMTGGCGNGKTFAAVAIAKWFAIKKSRVSRIANSESLYAEWREASLRGSPKELAEKFQQTPLLILDDLGQGEITDTYARWLYSVINSRYENKRPTVVTTNLTSEQFRAIFGNAMLSRLSDGEVWKFEGEDNRVKNVDVKTF